MLQVNPSAILKALLLQEDIDRDKRITVDDNGHKKVEVIQLNGNIHEVESTYYLSNLLQELALTIQQGNTEKGGHAPAHRRRHVRGPDQRQEQAITKYHHREGALRHHHGQGQVQQLSRCTPLPTQR